jgi:hypothetical protein
VNAGASDTEKLAAVVEEAIKELGLNLKVGWVGGDEVTNVVNKMIKEGEKFENICTGGELKDWGFEPITAQWVDRQLDSSVIDSIGAISVELGLLSAFATALTLSSAVVLQMLLLSSVRPCGGTAGTGPRTLMQLQDH